MDNIFKTTAIWFIAGSKKIYFRSRKNSNYNMAHNMSKCVIAILIIVIANSCHTKQEGVTTIEKNTTFTEKNSPLQIVSISGLPDSLRPKTIYVDKEPPPLKVEIPSKEGGFYTIKRPNGDINKIMTT